MSASSDPALEATTISAQLLRHCCTLIVPPLLQPLTPNGTALTPDTSSFSYPRTAVAASTHFQRIWSDNIVFYQRDGLDLHRMRNQGRVPNGRSVDVCE
jgi:hypothetical protein